MTSSSDELIDNALLDRYIAGECTLSEMRQVSTWIAAHPKMGDVVTQLRTGSVSARVDAQVDWERVRADMKRDESRLRSSERHQLPHVFTHRSTDGTMLLGTSRSQSLRRHVWSFLPTALLVLLTIGVGWLIVPFSSKHQPMAMATYTTGNGQRANVMLSDGSTVALNVASRLDVPADYAMGNHTLRLSGEALFTVLHHDKIPFTVVTGHTVVTVLGTRFVVRNYKTDAATSVVVQDGKLSVRSLVIPAGREVEISRSNVARVHPADESQFSFATGVLVLTGTRLPVAISELDRWYGVDIRLGSQSLANQEMTGRLPAGSLTDLVALLELTYDVRVVREGRILTLYRR